jgi:hypothetical protein
MITVLKSARRSRPMPRELDEWEQLLRELECERYAPVLPPPPARRQPRARQTSRPARRPTGTGWPA